MQKKLQYSDFHDNNSWLIFRMDAFLKESVVDIYTVMDLPSGMILSSDVIESELNQKQGDALLEQALFKGHDTPKKILIADNEPALPFLRLAAKKMGIDVEAVSELSLEDLTEEVRRDFANHMGESSAPKQDDFDEAAKRSIPDSYDLCSCGSGLKYKFCCKRILPEIVNAMVAAEDGNFKEAFDWIGKAKKIVGTTAETLLREGIIYSFFDRQKAVEFVDKCLEMNPNHPRAHCIRAISFTEQGDLEKAIQSYETAISHYPKTDHFHLNEVHCNLGTVYFKMGNYEKAKSEWEFALKLRPSDKTSLRNLRDFIYNKS